MTLQLLTPVMGIQTPRIKHVPNTATSNAYLEAVELASAYGVEPMPWQVEALKAIMSELTGKWAFPLVGISVPRQNGKGTVLEIRELYGLVVLGERIIHTAHEVKTADDHFRRMKEGFFENDNYPDLKKLVRKVVNKNGYEAIYLKNGGSIRFISRSKGSGRGFTADLLVLDEAQELDDIKHAAVQAVLTTSDHPQQILTGTPPGPADSSEVYTKLRNTALEGISERIAWLEWSAEKGSDLDDPATWAQANPGLGFTINIETLADFRTSTKEESFGREQCGMWDGVAAKTVIDMDYWETLASTQIPSDPVAFAIDVAPDRSSASIGVAGYVKWTDPVTEEESDVVYVEVAHSQKGTGWIVDKVKRYCEVYSPVAVLVDEKANNGELVIALKRAGIRVTIVTGPDVSGSWGTFMDRVNNRQLIHADMPLLDTALMNATTRRVLSGYAWDRKNVHGDITPLIAVTFAAYGLVQKRKPKGAVTKNEQPGEMSWFT